MGKNVNSEKTQNGSASIPPLLKLAAIRGGKTSCLFRGNPRSSLYGMGRRGETERKVKRNRHISSEMRR